MFQLSGWVLLALLLWSAIQMEGLIPLDQMRDMPGWLVFMIFCFAMVLCGFTWLPAEASALAIGAWYGAAAGFWVIWLTAMIAAVLAYGFAHQLPRPDRWQKHQTRLNDLAQSRGIIPALLMVRLIPLVPFFAINLGAGYMAVPFRTYFWTTAIGIVPASILMAVIGAGMA